jgi:hypothetical protein
MNRSLEQAWPTCYGAESYEFRPRLPPRHPLVAQEHMFVDEYVEYLWSKHHNIIVAWRNSIVPEWQGYKDTPPWDQVANDIKTGAHNWVEARRLPPNPPNFVKPSFWSNDEIVAFAAYIREHQDRLDKGDLSAENTAFQWCEKDDEGKFRQSINPINELVYPEESSFYYLAMQKYKFSSDHYVSQAPIFNDAACNAVACAGIGNPNVVRVMNLLEAYNLLPYPEVCDDCMRVLLITNIELQA